MPPLVAVAKDYEKLWEGVAKATNEVEAVRALAQIVFDKHGRAFTLGLKPKDAELCVETLDYVSCDLRLPPVFAASDGLHQGITEQHLKTAEKAAFFLTLRRLAEQHELLPDRMRIREPIEVSNEIAAAGGFGDVRIGWYDEGLVAVKTVRVAARDNIQKIRKVSISGVFAPRDPNHSTPEILQGSYSLGNAIPSEHPEARWSSRGHRETTIRHCIGVDGAREHHGVHKKKSRQETGTGACLTFPVVAAKIR